MEWSAFRLINPTAPEGYVRQHTLWTRRTFELRPDSDLWRNSRGMVLYMPAKEENKLHVQFLRMQQYREYNSGLPLPTKKLTELALAHLRSADQTIGRKQQFESVMHYMQFLADTTIGESEVNEAKIYAGHLALQMDFYGNVLTAEEERELRL